MRRHSPYNYAFDNPIYFVDPDGMMPFGNGGRRRTTGKHTFKYDTNPQGVKKKTGTDYITETSVTYTSNKVDGKSIYTTITSTVTIAIDSDGVIDKNNVQQNVRIEANTGKNGKMETNVISGTIDYESVSDKQSENAERVAEEKSNLGHSPLEDKADNINLAVEITASVAVGVATGGSGTAAQVAARTVVAGAAGGVAAATLIPDVSPESLTNDLYDDKEVID